MAKGWCWWRVQDLLAKKLQEANLGADADMAARLEFLRSVEYSVDCAEDLAEAAKDFVPKIVLAAGDNDEEEANEPVSPIATTRTTRRTGTKGEIKRKPAALSPTKRVSARKRSPIRTPLLESRRGGPVERSPARTMTMTKMRTIMSMMARRTWRRRESCGLRREARR